MPPPVAVTVNEYAPGASDEEVEKASAKLQVGVGVQLAGANEHVISGEGLEQLSVTGCAAPVTLIWDTVAIVLEEPPAAILVVP